MDHHSGYTETCTMIPSQHQYTVQRFAYASQESMLLHASVESGICARKAWGSRFQKARTATKATFSALSDKSPLQRGTASIKNHWSCNVHQKKDLQDGMGADVSSRMYVYSPYTICLRNCLTQACATKGFAYAGLLWHDSFNSHQGRLWKMLMLPGRMKVLHLKATRPIEFDPVQCIATIIPYPRWCCSNEAHGFFHSRENNSRCLKSLFALSGQNQAHNWTSIFHMNVLSNMLLYWAGCNMC